MYDANFKPTKETSEVVDWISFLNLLLTFFVKESLFSIASAVENPSIGCGYDKKRRPSCARLKVLVDLLAKLPEANEIKWLVLNKMNRG